MAIPKSVAFNSSEIDLAVNAIKEVEPKSHPALAREFSASLDKQHSHPKHFDPTKIYVTSFANRDPLEFETEEFKIYMASIEATKGNEVPAAVYKLEEPINGCTHALIFGHRRLTACMRTGNQFLAIEMPKPSKREHIARMTRENDDRANTRPWVISKWIANCINEFDSQRQYSNLTGTPEATVAKALKIATLPPELGDLSTDPISFTWNDLYKAALFLESKKEQFNSNFEELKNEIANTGVKLDNKDLFKRLTHVEKKTSELSREKTIALVDKSGAEFGTFKVNRAKELRMTIKDITPAEEKKILEILQRFR